MQGSKESNHTTWWLITSAHLANALAAKRRSFDLRQTAGHQHSVLWLAQWQSKGDSINSWKRNFICTNLASWDFLDWNTRNDFFSNWHKSFKQSCPVWILSNTQIRHVSSTNTLWRELLLLSLYQSMFVCVCARAWVRVRVWECACDYLFTYFSVYWFVQAHEPPEYAVCWLMCFQRSRDISKPQ